MWHKSLQLLLFLLTLSRATIYQLPDLSKDPAVGFDVMLSGEEQQCTSMFAQGTLREVSMLLTTNISTTGSSTALPADVYLLITLPDATCLQIGGFDVYSSSCLYSGMWPVSWSDDSIITNTATNYSAVLLFDGSLSGHGEWFVCVGNGLSSNSIFALKGAIHFSNDMIPIGVPPAPSLSPTPRPTTAPSPPPDTTAKPTISPTAKPTRAPVAPTLAPSRSPTRPPSPPSISVTSACIDLTSLSSTHEIIVEFDCSLSAAASCCVSAFVNSTLVSLYIDYTYTSGGSNTGESASDMALTITSTAVEGLQIGGLDKITRGISTYASWPPAWGNPSSNTYTDSITLSSEAVSTNKIIPVDICVINDWRSSSSVPNYRGVVTLSGLTSYCIIATSSPSLSPTATPIPLVLTGTIGEEVAVDIAITNAIGGSSRCLSIPTSGVLSSISLSITFSPTDTTSLASDLLLYLSLPTITTSTCLQVGGRDLSYDCPHSYQWPEEWSSSEPGVYSATVATTASATYGDHTLCLVNGFSTSDPTNYLGSTAMQGLAVTEITQVPSMAPTSPAAVHSASGSSTLSESSTAIIATVVVIVVVCLVACYLIRSRNRKERLQFIRSHPSEENIIIRGSSTTTRLLMACYYYCCYCFYGRNSWSRTRDDASSDGGGERSNEIRLRPLWQQHSSIIDEERGSSGYEANVEDLIVFVDDDRKSADSGSPRNL